MRLYKVVLINSETEVNPTTNFNAGNSKILNISSPSIFELMDKLERYILPHESEKRIYSVKESLSEIQ